MKKRRRVEKSSLTEDTFWQRQSTASATECTGLVPSASMSEVEALHYGALYAIHPPKAPRD